MASKELWRAKRNREHTGILKYTYLMIYLKQDFVLQPHSQLTKVKFVQIYLWIPLSSPKVFPLPALLWAFAGQIISISSGQASSIKGHTLVKPVVQFVVDTMQLFPDSASTLQFDIFPFPFCILRVKEYIPSWTIPDPEHFLSQVTVPVHFEPSASN